MTVHPSFPIAPPLGLLAALVLPAVSAPRASAEPVAVAELVDRFDPENYRDLVTNRLYTQKGMNRAAGTGPENVLCREFIHAELLSYGLDVRQDVFDYVDTAGVPRIAGNVIAVLPGLRNPDNEIYVIGAHFDSEDNPGADDNGTGVAALLEMARIFSRQPFARTIVFCAFDAEEIFDFSGTRRLGSSRFVEQNIGANIRGMISVDMIGWQARGQPADKAWIYGRPELADTIRNDLAEAIRLHGDGLEPVLRPGAGDYSDHVAFADAGYEACLLIEGSFTSNPNYHQAGDYSNRPNYLDWDYAARMSRSAIGYFAAKLEPLDPLPVMTLSRSPDGPATLHLSGLPGCTYAVEQSTTLGVSGWVPLASGTTSTENGTLLIEDPLAASRPTNFYRARFVPGPPDGAASNGTAFK